MEVDPGLASIITAVCTGLALYGGHLLARRGQREQNTQVRAAGALEAIVARADRAEARETYERERADREHDRAEQLEERCDRLREEHLTAVQNVHAEYADRYRCMSEVLVLMHKTVRNEIVKTAAEMVLDEAAPMGADEIDRMLGAEVVPDDPPLSD